MDSATNVRVPLGLVAFGVAVAYLHGIGSPALAPRWALLSLCIPFIMLISRTLHVVDWGHLWMTLLIVWATISLAWTPNLYGGLDVWWHYMLYAGLFLLAARLADLNSVYIGFGLGIATNSLVALYQFANGIGTYAQGDLIVQHPGGLFLNAEYMGEAAALAIVANYRRWPLALACLPALALSGSRTGWLAISLAALWWCWEHRHYWIVLVTAPFLAIICLVWSQSPSVLERFQIWHDALAGWSIFGHGIGSFWFLAPAYGGLHGSLPARPLYASMDALQVLFELGLLGLGLWLRLGIGAFVRSWGVDRLVLIAVISESLITTISFSPATGFMAVAVLGHVWGYWYRLPELEPNRRKAELPSLRTAGASGHPSARTRLSALALRTQHRGGPSLLRPKPLDHPWRLQREDGAQWPQL